MIQSPRLRNMTGLYLTRGEEILLLFREGSRVVNHLWVPSAGGHFEPPELNDPEACVLRELKEELSLSREDLDMLDYLPAEESGEAAGEREAGEPEGAPGKPAK